MHYVKAYLFRMPNSFTLLHEQSRYWLKLVSLPIDSLLGSCYALQYNECLQGKENWASKIRDILFRYGFGYAWENQSVQDLYNFITLFSNRVKDCELQQWSTDSSEMSKLRTYRLIKDCRNEELYLSLPLPRRLRVALARFRTGSHNLEIETGRHHKMRPEDRLCKLCGLVNNIIAIEDEFHVLLHCSVYNDLRAMYFGTDVSNLYDFVSIMKS